MSETIQLATPYGAADAYHWYLTDREQMWQALKELCDSHGHRGVMQCWPQNGELVWQFEANDHDGNAVTAVLYQHLVLVPGERLSVYDQKVYETLTTPTQSGGA